jgi:hypothetical protein
MSEFGIVLVVVGAVSVWLGFRLFRFLRRITSVESSGGPACAAGCPSCSKEAPGCAVPSMLADLEKVTSK